PGRQNRTTNGKANGASGETRGGHCCIRNPSRHCEAGKPGEAHRCIDRRRKADVRVRLRDVPRRGWQRKRRFGRGYEITSERLSRRGSFEGYDGRGNFLHHPERQRRYDRRRRPPEAARDLEHGQLHSFPFEENGGGGKSEADGLDKFRVFANHRGRKQKSTSAPEHPTQFRGNSTNLSQLTLPSGTRHTAEVSKRPGILHRPCG